MYLERAGSLFQSRWRLGIGRVAQLLAISGVTYFCFKIATSAVGFDFRLIWVAGKLWSAGISPYGADFIPTYDRLLHAARPGTHFWVYPPYWLPICVTAALFQFRVASSIWAVLNGLLLLAGSHLFAKSTEIPLSVVLAPATLVDASVLVIWYGQTSLLVFAGVALLYVHAASGKRLPGVGALVLLAFKPNVGVFFFLFMTLRRKFAIVAAAGATIILLSLPSMVLSGTGDLTGFLHAVAAYGAPAFPANQPPDMTGLANLASLVTTSSEITLGCLLAMVSATLWLGLRDAGLSEQERVSGIVVLMLLFVPLHDYDLSVAVLPLLAIAKRRRQMVAPVAGLLLLLVRPGWVVDLTDLRHPASTTFANSLLLSLTIATMTGLWLYSVKRPTPPFPSAAKT